VRIPTKKIAHPELIAPITASVYASQTQQFTAAVANASNTSALVSDAKYRRDHQHGHLNRNVLEKCPERSASTL
jgi:hypothetical protein